MARARVVVGGLVALVALTAASASPGSAAGAAEVAVGFLPTSGDQYVRPGVSSTTVSYCISEASTIDIEVRDAQGAVVRHLVSGVSRPAITCPASSFGATWDLRDDGGVRVPDGVYEVVVHAVTAIGDEGTGSVLRGVYSGPVAEFTAPAEGATISSPATFTVRTDPGFLAHFTPTLVAISCRGPFNNPRIGSTEEITPDGEATLVLDLQPCAVGPGEVAAHVRYTDVLGGREEVTYATRRAVVVQQPGPFSVALAHTPAEGWSYTFEELAVRGCVSRPASVTVAVTDAAGATIRDLSPSGTVDPSDCSTSFTTFAVWDHRDASGAVVPDGTYAIEVVAVDASGTEIPAPSGTVTVTRHVVRMEPLLVTAPAPGATLSGPTTIVVERPPGSDPGIDVGALIIDCTSGPGPGALAWTTLPAGVLQRSIPTNVQICRDGPQQLTVAAVFLDPDGAVHIAQTNLPITVFHPTLSPGTGHVVERDSGSTIVHVPVALSVPSPFPVTATWRAVDGTASPGADFTTVATGTVTIAAGQTQATVPITVAGDDEPEGDELVFVRFALPDRARLGGLWGVGFATILDDDSGPRARAGSVTVEEGDAGTTTASVPVTLSEPSSSPVTVTWRTRDNSAVAPSDYVAATGSVTFAPGQTEATIEVAVVGNGIAEPDELVVVALTGATGGSVGGWLGLGFAFVTDDD
jgi:flagellar hook assembly protein FlgD